MFDREGPKRGCRPLLTPPELWIEVVEIAVFSVRHSGM